MRIRRRVRAEEGTSGDRQPASPERHGSVRVSTETSDLLEAQRVSHTGSWTIELPSRRTYRSPEYLRLLCVTDAQAEDLDYVFSRIDEGDRARVRAALDRLVEQGEELTETYRVHLPDGGIRVIDARGRREVDPASGRLRAVGTAQDVTELHAAEAARRAADARFRAVVEAAPDGLVIVDERGVIVLVNAGAQEMFGYSRDELIGAPVETLLPDSAAARHEAHVSSFVADPAPRSMAHAVELTGKRRDGTAFPVEVSLSPVITDSGLLVASSIRDVSARREAELEIARLAAIVESSQDAIIGRTLDGTITSWNRAAEALYGYSAAEAIGRPITMIMVGDEQEQEVRSILRRIAAGELVGQLESKRRTKDGSILDVSLVVSPIRDSRGEVVGVATIGRDVTERNRAEAALAAARARFQAAFENAPIGIAIVGLKGSEREHIVQANSALAQMIGWRPGELDGVAISSITHPDDAERTDQAYEQLDRGLTAQIEKRFVHRDGDEVWALVTTTPIPGADGQPSAYAVTQVLDITERKRFEGQLRFLADHDNLTGLFNRHRFEVELERVVHESRRYGRSDALLILDLDGFKNVNDRFGHSVGDELVRRVASVMAQSIRDTDILARIGGDEFAVILQECGEGEAERVAANLLDAIRRRGVILAEGHSARVTTSIGITSFGGDREPTAAELIVEADIAMYDAKAEGKDRYALYDRDADRRRDISERHSWLERLRRAIDDDEFILHAQPIVGICANDVPRYELLLRLPDEQGGLIPPGAFLYNAERFGLMGDIDRWVLRHAVRLLHDHAAAGNELALAVNLSGTTMNDLWLSADLGAMLRAHPIPDGRLVIEVTETAAIVNMDRARGLARDLRALGCRFALDDFGAGFASFYYLKHLDFDYLKIDGEFIRQLTTTTTDQLVVRAVVEIANGLRTQTVAEFVGDDQTVELLRKLGVNYGQGYHLGRPQPLEEILPSLPVSPQSGPGSL